MHIGVIVGSLRADSFNRRLFQTVLTLVPPSCTIADIPIHAIPLFNEDEAESFPSPVATFRKRVTESDRILFITPEYNRSIPGVLKNAIDWGSWKENVFSGKVAGVMGVTPGSLGTAPMQMHLRSILLYLHMRVIGQPEVYIGNAGERFNEKGLIDDSTKRVVQKFLDRFIMEP